MLSSSLTPGDNTHVFRTEIGTIGGLICFDSIYEALSRDSVLDGADLLILSTNDSWYKDSAAVYQHNGHAVLRAIENGRYLVRAANTGISSILSPYGDITASLEPLKTGYVVGEISMESSSTLYTILGNAIVWLSLGYLLFLVFLRTDDWVHSIRQKP